MRFRSHTMTFTQVMQGCDTERAIGIVERMAVAAHQALAAAANSGSKQHPPQDPQEGTQHPQQDPQEGTQQSHRQQSDHHPFGGNEGGGSGGGNRRLNHDSVSITTAARAAEANSKDASLTSSTTTTSGDSDNSTPWEKSSTYFAWLYRMQVRTLDIRTGMSLSTCPRHWKDRESL